MKSTLIVTTMNEIAGMRAIMPRIKREWVDQIMVLDGGSTDGTVEFAREQGYDVVQQKRRGLRMAYIESYSSVRGDIVVTFSPDGNSIPELIPQLIAKMREGYDMVIVSRYLADAKSEDDTVITGLGNGLFTRIINTLFGGKYTDSLVIFRAYRRGLPQELGLTRVRSDFYEKWLGRYLSWEPQLSVLAASRGMKVAEIPGDEPARILSPGKTGGLLLPDSRIGHYKVGFACLYMFVEEFLRQLF